MTTNGEASVNPSQPWTQDGTALVTPNPPLSGAPRTMPLENRDPGSYTIYQSAYPLGLIVIPAGHGPATSPADLPLCSSSGSSYQMTEDLFHDCPDGFVVWFATR